MIRHLRLCSLLVFQIACASQQHVAVTHPAPVNHVAPAPGSPILLLLGTALFVDQTEVPVADYRRCVAASACTPPKTGPRCNALLPERDEHPVNCVTAIQAETFCRWAGKRLPDAPEWDRLDGASLDRLDPWEVAILRVSCQNRGDQGTCAVLARRGDRSPEGVMGLGGNVREWTRSPWDPGPELRALLGESADRMVRGPAFSDDVLPLSRIFQMLPSHEAPEAAEPEIGFRCVRDARADGYPRDAAEERALQRAREVAPLPERTVPLDGEHTLKVEASLEVRLLDSTESIENTLGRESELLTSLWTMAPSPERSRWLVVPIGTERPLLCLVGSASTSLKGLPSLATDVSRLTGARLFTDMDLVEGDPTLYLETEHQGDEEHPVAARLLKIAVLLRSDWNAACIHDETGFVRSFRRIASGLFRSLPPTAPPIGLRGESSRVLRSHGLAVGYRRTRLFETSGGLRVLREEVRLNPEGSDFRAFKLVRKESAEEVDPQGRVRAGTYVTGDLWTLHSATLHAEGPRSYAVSLVTTDGHIEQARFTTPAPLFSEPLAIERSLRPLGRLLSRELWPCGKLLGPVWTYNPDEAPRAGLLLRMQVTALHSVNIHHDDHLAAAALVLPDGGLGLLAERGIEAQEAPLTSAAPVRSPRPAGAGAAAAPRTG